MFLYSDVIYDVRVQKHNTVTTSVGSVVVRFHACVLYLTPWLSYAASSEIIIAQTPKAEVFLHNVEIEGIRKEH